ncbi:hypothetical protein NDU88_002528 [Pleurodeles waltl]|uniref:Uncharacterized protein n=1 Tax=Pleurodeles waltl TaxID=8319 RepID=A0AAV7W3B1_PLEWA|nr:hypothetical protein NDU88_002528 [Pleurodeles waltl]
MLDKGDRRMFSYLPPAIEANGQYIHDVFKEAQCRLEIRYAKEENLVMTRNQMLPHERPLASSARLPSSAVMAVIVAILHFRSASYPCRVIMLVSAVVTLSAALRRYDAGPSCSGSVVQGNGIIFYAPGRRLVSKIATPLAGAPRPLHYLDGEGMQHPKGVAQERQWHGAPLVPTDPDHGGPGGAVDTIRAPTVQCGPPTAHGRRSQGARFLGLTPPSVGEWRGYVAETPR